MTRPGRPSHPQFLTPREQEVVALLREGLTNPQIAERLSITLDGAKYHVSEILSKLGVSSREEAARWQPSERPWWATAIAPLAWPWRRANVSWLATAVAGVTAVLLVVGVGLLVWGLVRTDGDADASTASGATVAASPTALLPPPTPTAEPTTPQPTPAATALLPTQPPPTAPAPPAPTPDTRVAIMDLPTADQIQLGEDGKYFIADRGDGCTWVERMRQTVPKIGEIAILHTDCPTDFAYTYELASGEVSLLLS